MLVLNSENTFNNTNNLRDELRAKTANSHKNLESLSLSQAIVSPKVTKEEYALYLSLMHDIQEKMEMEIFPLLENIILDLDNRKKSHHILADLNAIGFQKKKSGKTLFFPSQISSAFALGMMYVIEGSTLGGRFILKNIETSLDYNLENGASYFNGYGAKTGSIWKKFIDFMEDYETNNGNQEEIINGANFAFTMVGEHLSKNYTK